MRGPVEETKSSSVSRSQRDIDFSDYMWMGEEMEEFDKKVVISLVFLLASILN
jgi:hypothetical protein